ncbi:MAG: hypothetical protein ACYCTI_08200 [Acidimicrobiales bacterium]
MVAGVLLGAVALLWIVLVSVVVRVQQRAGAGASQSALRVRI